MNKDLTFRCTLCGKNRQIVKGVGVLRFCGPCSHKAPTKQQVKDYFYPERSESFVEDMKVNKPFIRLGHG